MYDLLTQVLLNHHQAEPSKWRVIHSSQVQSLTTCTIFIFCINKSLWTHLLLTIQYYLEKVKGKRLSICIAHRRVQRTYALFVTNQSRRSHSRRVQPANTGWRTDRPGSPVSCTKVPTFHNPYNGLLLI